jgi:hypothetical protein
MPIMLHGAAAADDDDDDDGVGSGGGKLSKGAKKKAARALADAQQANRDAKKLKANGGGGGGGGGGGRGTGFGAGGKGGGGGSNAPGDLAERVELDGDSVTFHWPKGQGPNGRPKEAKTFDVAGIKKELTAAGVKDVSTSKLCVPFQFMYALSTSITDDDKRLAHAHRFCHHPQHKHHNSVTASAHDQLPGLDRTLLMRPVS